MGGATHIVMSAIVCGLDNLAVVKAVLCTTKTKTKRNNQNPCYQASAPFVTCST